MVKTIDFISIEKYYYIHLGVNMNKVVIKTVSAAAVFAMLLSVSSCGKFKGNLSEVRTVSADSEWWDDKTSAISRDDVLKATGTDPYHMFSKCYAADEDSVVLSVDIFDKKDNSTHLLMHCSYDGEILGQVNTKDCFGGADSGTPYPIYKHNDKYYAFIEKFTEDRDSYVRFRYEIDFEGGTLKDQTEIKIPGNGFIVDAVDVDGKLVYLVNSQSRYKLYVDDGKNPGTYDIDLGKGLHIESVDRISRYGNGISFIANAEEHGRSKEVYCTLDLGSFTVNPVELKPNNNWMIYVVPESGAVALQMDDHVISKVDPVSADVNKLVDLSATYVWDNWYSEILWAADDTVVLFNNIEYGDAAANLIKLTRSSGNPNAGKKILSLAYLDELYEFRAINEFNRKSDKYFIETDNKYYGIENGYYDQDGWAYSDVISSETNAIDILKADIREGKGPDILLYGTNAAQLNSTDCLIDLTGRINSGKSLKSGDYMDFVTSPNGRDGKHYRLDYGFRSTVCLVNNSLIDDKTAGLTFDQYDRIIEERNEGRSILPEGDLPLMGLFVNSSDCFTYGKDGKFMLGSEVFKGMSDYIASIPDGMVYDHDYESYSGKLQILNDFTFETYVYTFEHSNLFKDFSIVGLPSADGHPEAVIGRGIGITACCPLQDAAWEFAMTLMSPEFQGLMHNSYDPVLKSAQKDAFSEYIKNISDYRDPLLAPIPDGVVDYYIEQISDAVVVPDIDSAVLVIMNEEMPAYFEGQKPLDEVCAVIENRVNLMLAERG